MSVESVNLVAELAVGITRMLQSNLAFEKDERGFYFHGFQGPFDEACYVLWELDVARAASKDGKSSVQWSEAHHLSDAATFCFFPANETRTRIVSRVSFEQALVDRVITVFLKLACEFGQSGSTLSISRDPFCPQAGFELEIAALEKSGHLARFGTSIQWNEQIGPLMKALEFWDNSGFVPTSRKIHLSNDTEKMVKTYLSEKNPIAAIKIICRHADTTIEEAVLYIKNTKND